MVLYNSTGHHTTNIDSSLVYGMYLSMGDLELPAQRACWVVVVLAEEHVVLLADVVDEVEVKW